MGTVPGVEARCLRGELQQVLMRVQQILKIQCELAKEWVGSVGREMSVCVSGVCQCLELDAGGCLNSH